MAFELSKEQEARVLAAFMEVLDAAVPAYELAQYKLFEPRDEEFIRKEVERKLYEPQLPCGGQRERDWVGRFKKLAHDKTLVVALNAKAWLAAQKWSEVDGWYYARHPLKPKENKAAFTWHSKGLEAAREEGLWEQAWFHEMMLKGLPELVADFRMECLFLLRRSDGHTDRLVRLRNVVNEKTKAVPLPADEYRAPEKFRGWCLDHGNFHWGGNQTHLQSLHLDIGRASAWRVVNQVCQFGWLPLKPPEAPGAVKLDGLWLYADSAWANGEQLLPDEHGVYWYAGEGYRMNETGRREIGFYQKAPRMYPEFDLRRAKLRLAKEQGGKGEREQGGKEQVGKGESGKGGEGEELALLRLFYQETCERMRKTMSSLDAYLLIGGMLAYAAAPEIFQERSEFTGIWLHGPKESGKSTMVGLLMEFVGQHLGRQGMSLRGDNSSPAGLLEALDQYSNIPLWADEFRYSQVSPDKISVLQQTYNRGGQTKCTVVKRECRTNFIVSGESTTDDAALRGRYMHIQMSADAREKLNGQVVAHEVWFNEHRSYFFVFFRHLLKHRAEFTELTLKVLKTWRENPDLSERTKLAFGIPYAAFVAMAHLLESHPAEELAALRRHALAAAADAAADVTSETNINVVWEHLITAFRAKEIPQSCFRLRWDHLKYPPEAPQQEGWKSYELFMDVNATLGALNEYLVKQRIPMTLNRKDLRDQFSKERSWLPGKHTQRFGTGSESVKSWGFKVDAHEMGYRKVSDAEADHFLQNGHEADPRKGPLFAIVHAIEKDEVART